jgi:hypothetical protein
VFRILDDVAMAPTVGAQPAPTLTPRERDVLLALLFRPSLAPGPFTEPASTKEIAQTLVVSDAAVKQHLSHLFDKFGVHAGLDRRRLRLANAGLARLPRRPAHRVHPVGTGTTGHRSHPRRRLADQAAPHRRHRRPAALIDPATERTPR